MTAHPIAPMTDAELAALRVESTIRHSSHHTMASVSIDAMQRLFALVDALKARALPPARLMRTVEEVEGLRPGNYLVRHRGEDRTIAYERGSDPSWRDPRSPWLEVGDNERVPNDVFVGATVVGPLPDVEPLGEEG